MNFTRTFSNISSLLAGWWRRISRFGRNPYRDWVSIVGVFLLVNIILLIFGISIFWGIWNGSALTPQERPEVSITTINRSKLDEVSSFVRKQNQTFSELKAERPSFPRP